MNLQISELEKYLERYLSQNRNVLITGLHGVGKTHIIKKVLTASNIKFYYCSGATLDPWIDFIGVPKEVEIDGRKVLDFIRPKNISSDIEVIVIDEYNRAPKAVRNACMELIQFRTLNGERFPNLRCIWAAINPDDDNTINYDVDKLDSTQKDRFEIHLHLPYEINLDYFRDKYSDHIDVDRLNSWWRSLKGNEKLDLSPRRLEMAIQQSIYQDPIVHIFPKGISTLGFDQCLKSIPQASTEIIDTLLGADETKISESLNDPSNATYVANAITHLCTEGKMKNENKVRIASCLDLEVIASNYEKYVPLIASLIQLETDNMLFSGSFELPRRHCKYSEKINDLICATVFDATLKSKTRDKALNKPILDAINSLDWNPKVILVKELISDIYRASIFVSRAWNRVTNIMPEGLPYSPTKVERLFFLNIEALEILRSKTAQQRMDALNRYRYIMERLINNDGFVPTANLSSHLAILKWALKGDMSKDIRQMCAVSSSYPEETDRFNKFLDNIESGQILALKVGDSNEPSTIEPKI